MGGQQAGSTSQVLDSTWDIQAYIPSSVLREHDAPWYRLEDRVKRSLEK